MLPPPPVLAPPAGTPPPAEAVALAEVSGVGTVAVAVGRLNAELTQVTSRHRVSAIADAIRHDRHILDVGGSHVTRVEQGLEKARGLADKQATTDQIYIPNHLFTTLTQLVRQDRSTGADITRSGRRSANSLAHNLNVLGDGLTSTVSVKVP